MHSILTLSALIEDNDLLRIWIYILIAIVRNRTSICPFPYMGSFNKPHNYYLGGISEIGIPIDPNLPRRHFNGTFMTNIYLKSAYRSLSRNKNYTIINITGLALGMAACLLIGLFVYNELSFDNNIPGSDQLYRLNEYEHYDGAAPQVSASIGPPIAAFLKNNHSEIESYTRVLPATPFIYPSITLEYQGKKIKTNQLVCTDTTFATMFNAKLLEGEKSNFLLTPNSIVLTHSLAQKLFGDAPALNKTLQLHTGDTSLYITVSNVMADMPANSHLHIDGLMPVPQSFENGFLGQNYGVLLGPSYLRIRKNTDINRLQEQLTATIHTKNKGIDMRLQSFKQIHTGSADISFDELNYKKTDGKYVTIFMVVALAIFLIGCINFVNLTIAIAGYRGKEIAIKKLIGAKRTHVILQILTEAFLSVLLALGLAVVIAAVLLPYLNNILDRNLRVESLYNNTRIIGIYTIALIVTTLFAGLYPAMLISSSKVTKALKTKVLFTGSKASMRNILVTGQFIIAIIFITNLIVILQQLRFLQQKDLGYSYSQVIRVPLDVQRAAKLPMLRNELLKIKGIMDITNGYTELGGSGGPFGVDYIAPNGEHKHVSVNFENAASNYTSFFGIKIVDGRSFDKDNPKNQYLINETFAKQIGYTSPVGKEINLSSFPPGIIKGVVKDFNYSSLHAKIEPLIISSMDFVPAWQTQLYIKVATAGVEGTLKKTAQTLKTVSGDDSITYEFMDDHFKQVYHAERQAGTMIAIVGGLTIFIACMGLFGLSAFVALRRSKEVSIRKVLGASVMQVTTSLSKEFLVLIVIAITVGAPIAWLIMEKWLQNFAYRIHIHWWVFVLGGSMAILIAAIAISFQSIKAAMANPIKGLRTE